MGPAHVGLDFRQDPLLGRGKGKRKNLTETAGVPMADEERDSLFHERAAAPQGQAQFQEEEFIEDEPPVGRRFSVIEKVDIFIRFGIMGAAEGLGKGNEILSPADLLRYAAEFPGGKEVHCVLHDPADETLPLVEPFGFGINGHDASEMERLFFPRRRRFLPVWRFTLLFLQDLQFGVMDFLLKLVKPHFSKKDQAHPFFESSLHEPGIEIEPLGQQSPGFITEGQFEGSPPAIISQVGLKDSSHDRFDFARRKLGNSLDLPSVLVEAGKKIKGVFHG
jgi:hypothetical protein